MNSRSNRLTCGLRWLAPCLLLALAAPGAARAQGVTAGLTPASQTVAPGSEFEIQLSVTQAGSPFNGYVAVVSYDPAALTFLQASPVSLQQGCLMTGACSAACGSTFHLFSAAGDSLKVNHSLLCDDISLTGPGPVYKLRFRASETVQVTTLSIRRATFYDAGLFVTPLALSGCSVTIGNTTAVGPRSAAGDLELRALPNPARGLVQLHVRGGGGGDAELRVLDLLGRTVRRLPAGSVANGPWSAEWDGTNESGARAPAGVYVVWLRLGDRIRQTRVTLIW